MQKKYILSPGPTPIPEEVLLEQARPLIHHRSLEFSKILKEVTEKLKKLFKTRNDVFVLTSSGTGAMEAAISNSFSSGDKVLVARAGMFGELFEKICKKFGLDVISLAYEWGEEINSDDIREALNEDPDIKGVMVQSSETSTGVLHDVKTIGSIVKKYPAILIVDAVSGLGAADLRTDEWDLDIVVAGSQKALSAPAGAAFISISNKAWKLIEKSDLPRFYFDLLIARERLHGELTWTSWTPCISIIIAINKALDMLFEEGLEKVFKRHRILAEATQRAVEKLGLELFVKNKNSRGCITTSVNVPKNIDGKKLVNLMYKKYGITIGDGLGRFKGKNFRIGHLGYFGMFDTIIAISALEMALKELGFEFEVGSGVAEAEKVFIENNCLNIPRTKGRNK